MDNKLSETLQEGQVRLEPLQDHHIEPLRAACAEDQDIWEIYPINMLGDDFDKAIKAFHDMTSWVPFAVINTETGKVVGMTNYINPDQHGVVEIGVLEGEGHRADEIDRRAHRFDLVPEVTTDRVLPEGAPHRRQVGDVPAGVELLLVEGHRQAVAECGRRVGEGQERPREELRRLQLMVGEAMHDARALLRIWHAAQLRYLGNIGSHNRQSRTARGLHRQVDTDG